MADVEFRALPADRTDEFRRIVDYAFSPGEGPREYEEPPERIAERFGVFDGDELVSVCGHYGFSTRLRGAWVPLAGLAAVATPPEHRRRGHVRRLVDGSLRRWRGEFSLAALWPFDRAYYEQFGWATAGKGTKYTCPPAALSFARETRSSTGRARPVTVEEWERLQAVHERWAADRTLPLRRESADWWRKRVFQVDEDDRPYAYGFEDEGHLRGYLTYTVESTGEGFAARQLQVNDLVFADHDAYLGLLGFLADHDSQVSEVRFYRELESSLLDLTDDPSEVECELLTGPMVRVVDVKNALSTVPYPADISADVTMRVIDETAPWNDGCFHVSVADGDGECRCLTAAGSTGTDADAGLDVDLTIDIGTLSQLVVGYVDVATARQIGDVTVENEMIASTLSAVFPQETIAMGTFF